MARLPLKLRTGRFPRPASRTLDQGGQRYGVRQFFLRGKKIEIDGILVSLNEPLQKVRRIVVIHFGDVLMEKSPC